MEGPFKKKQGNREDMVVNRVSKEQVDLVVDKIVTNAQGSDTASFSGFSQVLMVAQNKA
jgi:hypothetical protein